MTETRRNQRLREAVALLRQAHATLEKAQPGIDGFEEPDLMADVIGTAWTVKAATDLLDGVVPLDREAVLREVAAIDPEEGRAPLPLLPPLAPLAPEEVPPLPDDVPPRLREARARADRRRAKEPASWGQSYVCLRLAELALGLLRRDAATHRADCDDEECDLCGWEHELLYMHHDVHRCAHEVELGLLTAGRFRPRLLQLAAALLEDRVRAERVPETLGWFGQYDEGEEGGDDDDEDDGPDDDAPAPDADPGEALEPVTLGGGGNPFARYPSLE